MSPQLTKWLKLNLGKNCLAALTGTDRRALAAAVAIVELYAYDIYSDRDALQAFHTVVSRMQPFTRSRAYHAIAMTLDWADRERLWLAAGLPVGSFGDCTHAVIV